MSSHESAPPSAVSTEPALRVQSLDRVGVDGGCGVVTILED
jgi:hypothetical protein